jgi:hypothetical protein
MDTVERGPVADRARAATVSRSAFARSTSTVTRVRFGRSPATAGVAGVVVASSWVVSSSAGVVAAAAPFVAGIVPSVAARTAVTRAPW